MKRWVLCLVAAWLAGQALAMAAEGSPDSPAQRPAIEGAGPNDDPASGEHPGGDLKRHRRPSARDPQLVALIEKAGRYVVAYEDAFRNLVAEETYEQQTQDGGVPYNRRSRAEIVFVVLGGPFRWGSFRDVFEVDGREVREREARLERLFARPGDSALRQAAAIREESARHNIGLYRTINEPTVPLMFLHPDNQRRFLFERGGRRRLPSGMALAVRFEEVGRPTMIAWERWHDLPARGTVWIDPREGVVLRSEVSLKLPYAIGKDRRRSGRISVDYRKDAHLDLWVPAEMNEVYPGLVARARYTNYRRFSVETQETIHYRDVK